MTEDKKGMKGVPFLDQIPKSFLLGASLALLICVIGLFAHASILASAIDRIDRIGKGGILLRIIHVISEDLNPSELDI